MKFNIITLFPEMFEGPLTTSILERAKSKGVFEVSFTPLRNFGLGTRRQVDDTPYGGGAGMVLRVDVMAKAIEAAKKKQPVSKVILLTPQGKLFNQEMARNVAEENSDIILVCGHYEGFDERIRALVDKEVSIGEYVLTGGEIAAMAFIDATVRLLPGALGKDESTLEESFSKEHSIEYPQYTKPEIWEEKQVPEVLLSGNHQKIKEWREQESEKRSKKDHK